MSPRDVPTDRYPENTIGRLMEPPLAVFPPHLTVGEATERVRELAATRVFTYGYIAFSDGSGGTSDQCDGCNGYEEGPFRQPYRPIVHPYDHFDCNCTVTWQAQADAAWAAYLACIASHSGTDCLHDRCATGDPSHAYCYVKPPTSSCYTACGIAYKDALDAIGGYYDPCLVACLNGS